jgi:hypothetical protein
MPTCHRCERENLPTAEVRRTSLGHVCIDGSNQFSACRKRERELRAERRAARRASIQATRRAESSAA